MASTSINLLSVKIFYTVILFCVNVPVLSEQIIDILPKLSTECNFRIIAFSSASFLVPKARTIVTIELRASGIAATARDMANMSESIIGAPRYKLSPNTMLGKHLLIRAFTPKI